MRAGEYANVSPQDFRKMREKHGLTPIQIATLGRSGIYRYKSGELQARRITDWESGKSRIPLASYELICAKIKLLESGVATYEELAKEPLVSILFPTDKEFTKSLKSRKSI